ncbi:CTLH/CRA C-terminal to LisH motif domain [Carpediemonas membranifera]|uniref:CTLH/CRA C-terminal to LisH motif domain n=1 Tax=Carpediemonas membranifera TaxID=201153 RepID=A0A8J6B8T1_9EUKA|nr:CTLH/CRA C-terminal to LisH motif domain [Carpediemonas membranifera]|eukprot:KAG9395117.1 CTLH/CRA C-terminal to LisH motif domain [Carpediemonas membranifera]
MSGNEASAAPFSMKRWKESMNDLVIRQDDLDKLILDYLVVEGYADVARTFASEAKGCGEIIDPTLDARSAIREAIEQGRIEEAMDRINDYDPAIIDASPLVVFKLQQLRLIGMIRDGRGDEAISFAQTHMATHGKANPELLPAMEETIALLAFPSLDDCPLKGILSGAFREEVASLVNSIILRTQYRESESKLEYLMKVLVWGQTELSKRASFPKIENLTTGELVDPSDQRRGTESEDTEMQAQADLTRSFAHWV